MKKKIFDFLMKKKEKKVQVPQSSLFLGVGNPDSSSNQGKQFLELHGPWWWCHGAQCTVHDQFYSRGRQQAEYMWMISLLLAHVTQLVLEYTVLAYSYIIVTIWKKLLISLGPTIWFCQNHSAGQCSSSTKDHQTVTLTSSHGYQQGTHTTNKITANRWHHMDINGTHTTRDWQDYCQQVTSHGHQPDTPNTSLTGLLPTAGITRTPTRHTHHVTDRITADRWHHTDTNRTHTLHITDRITANRWHHTHYTSLTGLLPTGDIIHQWDNIRKGQNT